MSTAYVTVLPMGTDEQRANLFVQPAERRCIDCRGINTNHSHLVCDECSATGPRGPGRCQIYECFALRDGWGCCEFCRMRKYKAIQAADPNALVTVIANVMF